MQARIGLELVFARVPVNVCVCAHACLRCAPTVRSGAPGQCSCAATPRAARSCGSNWPCYKVAHAAGVAFSRATRRCSDPFNVFTWQEQGRPWPGSINYRRLIDRRARMQGFVVFDYWERWSEAETALLDWYREGALVACEDIDDGLDKMPDSLASLFTGGNRGIKICRVAPDPEDIPAA